MQLLGIALGMKSLLPGAVGGSTGCVTLSPAPVILTLSQYNRQR
jgi:hypothetical protein